MFFHVPATLISIIVELEECLSELDFVHRKKSRTREDIQVLGLALEVRRIEQQLSQMNSSIGEARTLLARSVRSVKSPAKQTKRYTGLAGKVSQLAKQIVRFVGPAFRSSRCSLAHFVSAT